MELLMLLAMAACYALLLFKRNINTPFVLGVLSVEVIATFAILLFSGGSILALILFLGNLLVTPWIAFWRLPKRFSSEKDA